MKVMIRSDSCFFIYFFGVAFLQILELFVDIRLTKILFVIFVIALVVDFGKKLSLQEFTFFLCFESLCLTYYTIYLFIAPLNYGFARPALICMMVFWMCIRTLKFNGFDSWGTIENISILYLLLNIFFYFTKKTIFFQLDTTWRYVGGSANPNLLATLIFAIQIIEFWGRSVRSFIVRILSVILLLMISSRTYVTLCMFVFVIAILAHGKSQKEQLMRGMMMSSFGTVGFSMLLWYISKITDLLDRFVIKGMSSNGRSQLIKMAFGALKTADVNDVFWGIGLGNIYRKASEVFPTHSFGENSYLTIVCLFGVFGILTFFLYLYHLWNINENIFYKLLVGVVLLSYLFQDTICYIQGFFAINCALIIAGTDKRCLEQGQ